MRNATRGVAYAGSNAMLYLKIKKHFERIRQSLQMLEEEVKAIKLRNTVKRIPPMIITMKKDKLFQEKNWLNKLRQRFFGAMKK